MAKQIFKVGDQVQFLNETGGGTVVKVLDGGRYLLLDDDGFEDERYANELLKPFDTLNEVQDNVPISKPKVEESILQELEVIRDGLDVFEGIGVHEEVKPVDEVGRGTVIHISSNGVFSVVLDSGLTIEYRRTEIIKVGRQEEQRMIESVGAADSVRKADDYRKKMMAKKTNRKLSGVWEVDLHVHEITEDTDFLGPAELLQIQMDHFEKKLQEAMEKQVQKVIFIHGRGKGKLRNEIREVLKTYANCEFYDGDFQKYGIGATEVRIYRSSKSY